MIIAMAGTTTSCGGGYAIVATDKNIENGFKITIRR